MNAIFYLYDCRKRDILITKSFEKFSSWAVDREKKVMVQTTRNDYTIVTVATGYDISKGVSVDAKIFRTWIYDQNNLKVIPDEKILVGPRKYVGLTYSTHEEAEDGHWSIVNFVDNNKRVFDTFPRMEPAEDERAF